MAYPNIEFMEYVHNFAAPAIFRTSGTGLWSKVSRGVGCYRMDVDVSTDYTTGDFWGEAMVFFHPSSWNIHDDGLIYTDEQFLIDLKTYLWEVVGMDPEAACDIDYSEQGMQGDNYVSFDVGDSFILEFLAITQKNA